MQFVVDSRVCWTYKLGTCGLGADDLGFACDVVLIDEFLGFDQDI